LKFTFSALTAAVLSSLIAQGVFAQSRIEKSPNPYTTQPVRFIVPNAPGGPTDVVTRTVSDRLAERLGVPVLVENRAGASGTVGGDVVVKSAPDGRTLLLCSSSAFTSTPILVPEAPYDGRTALTLVTTLVSVPYVLLVDPAKGPASVSDFIARARANPGKMNYGSAGHGSTSHMVGALFGSTAGIQVTHIPYKGSSQAAADLLGGQLQFVFEAVAGGMQYIKGGRLKALAISSTKRLPQLPDVPTVSEAGVPGFEASVGHGVCVTSKTPAALVQRINQELVATLKVPEVRERLIGIGAEIVGNTPEEAQTAIRAEIPRWEKIVREVAAQSK
jgi:tripartite-type tricarboxylate transporter receptor subunit TctC